MRQIYIASTSNIATKLLKERLSSDEMVTCCDVHCLCVAAACERVDRAEQDDSEACMEEDVEDGVDDVVSALRRRPVSRSSSTTKRSHADLVTHQDFQPALVTADDGQSLVYLMAFNS